MLVRKNTYFVNFCQQGTHLHLFISLCSCIKTLILSISVNKVHAHLLSTLSRSQQESCPPVLSCWFSELDLFSFGLDCSRFVKIVRDGRINSVFVTTRASCISIGIIRSSNFLHVRARKVVLVNCFRYYVYECYDIECSLCTEHLLTTFLICSHWQSMGSRL